MGEGTASVSVFQGFECQASTLHGAEAQYLLNKEANDQTRNSEPLEPPAVVRTCMKEMEKGCIQPLGLLFF